MGANWILTATGERVSADTGVPTVADISLALSRLPRFSGHARQEWTVADHSLFCAALVGDADPVLRLAVLMHDWHEAMTGDVATPWKGKELRALQEKFDYRIFKAYFPGVLTVELREQIKSIDRRALLAEAHVVGPAVCNDPQVMLEDFGGMPIPDDIELLRRFCGGGYLRDAYEKLYPLAKQAWDSRFYA